MKQLHWQAIATLTFLIPFGSNPAWADGIVPAADGTGTQVTPNGRDHAITGGTPSADHQNLFHRFTEFNLLTGESATFITDPAVLNILSGVTGSHPSIINGLLQVSGSSANLFLINPNGILFGPDAALNLQGSLTAVTADQVNFVTGAFGTVGSSDYAALVGNPQSFSFSLEHPGSVVNTGNLAVPPGASVVLIGGQVLNTGTIAAPGGAVIISAVAGGNLVRIAQDGSLLNLEVATLPTDGAALTAFSPLSLPALLTGSEVALADSVTVNPDGSVQLANGAMVNPDMGTITVAGAIDVTASQGGQILVLGTDVVLTDTLINASGLVGGGRVRIGGDYQGQGLLPHAQTTQMDADSIMLADALDQGEGGQVILWADGDTLFQGFISAQGGPNGGDGGLIETSGRQTIAVDGGRAIAAAPAGTAGTWLLDPTNITIDRRLADTIQTTLAAGTNFVASTIEGATATASGALPGNGDIFLNSEIDAVARNNATLTLTASRYIQRGEFTDGVEAINISGGNLVLNLNQEGLAAVTNPTITNALDLIGSVTGNVTINLGAGTYQEGETIALSPGYQLQGAGARATILDGANAYPVLTVSASSLLGALPSRLSDLTIANGNAVPLAAVPESGGGITNFGNLIIDNSVIRDNRASGRGGGIANVRFATTINPDEGTLVINNSLISGNRADGDGGGISNEGGKLTINNSTIFGNASNDDGGGVDNNNDGGTVTLNNSTIFDNFAISNGAGVENDSIMTIANSTVVGNRLSGGLGAGVANSGAASQLTLVSSLVSGNRNVSGPENNVFNEGKISTSNNLLGQSGDAGIVGFTLAASDIVPDVPISQIVATELVDNGGATPTLALIAGSPAINSGSGSGPDQRGMAVSGAARDIGAFEFPLNSGGSGGSSSGDSGGGSSSGGDSSSDRDLECIAGDCNPTNPPATLTESSTAATSGEGTEVGFVQRFEEHLGVEAAAFEDIDALDRARVITGVTPALVYASFVPASTAPEVAEGVPETPLAIAGAPVKALPGGDELGQQIVAQAEGRLPTDAIADEDVLQLVLVTANNQPRHINTGATRAVVLAAVRQLQVELTDRTRRRLDAYLVPSQALYGWLMAPLEAALTEAEIGHVSFVLDEGLRSLPLAALHDGEQFIIENYSVGLMPSLSLTDTRIGNIRNAEVLAMGASEFSDQPALPAVPLEIAAINDLWPGTVHLNESFTPTTLVAERSANAYPVLHLATHGQFTSGALSNSYIQFWDRRMGLDELPQLQLGNPAVELLVLSACRTVLGDEEAELGFAGLAVKSGAKSAIAALWQVSDLETAGFMAELYTHLGQVTYKAEALRQAQLAMLQGDVTVQDGTLVWSGGQEPLPDAFQNRNLADTQHPYYWSAFTLVGNPW